MPWSAFEHVGKVTTLRPDSLAIHAHDTSSEPGFASICTLRVEVVCKQACHRAYTWLGLVTNASLGQSSVQKTAMFVPCSRSSRAALGHCLLRGGPSTPPGFSRSSAAAAVAQTGVARLKFRDNHCEFDPRLEQIEARYLSR